jgi:hypothetical protein
MVLAETLLFPRVNVPTVAAAVVGSYNVKIVTFVITRLKAGDANTTGRGHGTGFTPKRDVVNSFLRVPLRVASTLGFRQRFEGLHVVSFLLD